jgi:hypothetical protein
MKNRLTPDQFFKLFADLIWGMDDQYVNLMKTRAGLPYVELKTGLRLPDFPTKAEAETAAREVFEPAISIEEVELVLNYLEDGAIHTAADRLRKIISNHKKEITPNDK